MNLVIEWWYLPLALLVVGGGMLALIVVVLLNDYVNRPRNLNEWLGECKVPVGLLFAAACAFVTGLMK